MPEWRAGSDCSGLKAGMVDIREMEPNGRWGFIGCVAASVAEQIVADHNRAALATPPDAVQAAAERILDTHVDEDCPWCDDKQCSAVIVALAALSGHQAGGGEIRAHLTSLLDNLRGAGTDAAIGSDGWYVMMAIATLEKMLAALAAPAEGTE